MSNPSNLHQSHEDHPDNISRNARRGLVLFVLYFALYAVFITANVFAHDVMIRTTIPLGGHEVSLGGPNLAVDSGIALIFIAILLSLFYMRWTRLPDGPFTE